MKKYSKAIAAALAAEVATITTAGATTSWLTLLAGQLGVALAFFTTYAAPANDPA